MKRRVLVLSVAVVAVLAAAACRNTVDDAPPVATPNLTASRARVPQGSPVELTYRFAVAPTAPPLKKDYRVLVHFLDASEEIMWTDDHMPPIPTTQWKPGQTVEYTRTLFAPVYPYVGEVTVVMGLYAPGTDERVPLAGDSDGHRAYRVAKLRLLPETDNVYLIYQDGWNQAEMAGNNAAVKWQWTRKDATLRFRNPKRNAVFYLDLDGQPEMFDSPQTVTVYLGDQEIDRFPVAGKDEIIRKVGIKAAQFGADDMVDVRISVDKTFVPALKIPDNRDARELGVRVFHAFVDLQ
jgi:hypothetical protein